MPSIPVRKLGAVGIIRDVNPFDLQPNAWSDGLNVRFDNDKLSRAPVFRTVFDALTGTEPVFVQGVNPQNDFDYILYANANGRLFKYANRTEAEVTATGAVLATDPHQYTSTSVGGVVYFNRPHDQPYALTPAAATFATLTGWNSGWRCRSMRAFRDFVFAIGMTEGATEIPYRVRWGDKVIGQTTPPSWDETDTTRLAGYNDLTALTSPLVDGGPLGNNFILYSQDEVWLVELVGGTDIFDWRRLPFDNAGIIAPNCWVEVGGRHFVWGHEDIYVHDGVQKQSIIDNRNRDAFFRELNIKQAERFFVAHDKGAREILFCGISGYAKAGFKNPNGYCNIAAVYNYKQDTWSFRDLPNVSSASIANVNTVWTYDTVPASMTFDNVGGTYYDQEDSYARFPVFASVADTANGLSKSKIHVTDYADIGSVALPRDDEATKPAWAERTGLDLDEIGAELRGYKHARAIMPQITLFRDAVPLTMQIGGHEVASSRVEWEPAQTFDPGVDYKIDTREGGRYLAYRVDIDVPNDFEVSGFDLDVIITGRR